MAATASVWLARGLLEQWHCVRHLAAMSRVSLEELKTGENS